MGILKRLFHRHHFETMAEDVVFIPGCPDGTMMPVAKIQLCGCGSTHAEFLHMRWKIREVTSEPGWVGERSILRADSVVIEMSARQLRWYLQRAPRVSIQFIESEGSD